MNNFTSLPNKIRLQSRLLHITEDLTLVIATPNRASLIIVFLDLSAVQLKFPLG